MTPEAEVLKLKVEALSEVAREQFVATGALVCAMMATVDKNTKIDLIQKTIQSFRDVYAVIILESITKAAKESGAPIELIMLMYLKKALKERSKSNKAFLAALEKLKGHLLDEPILDPPQG